QGLYRREVAAEGAGRVDADARLERRPPGEAVAAVQLPRPQERLAASAIHLFEACRQHRQPGDAEDIARALTVLHPRFIPGVVDSGMPHLVGDLEKRTGHLRTAQSVRLLPDLPPQRQREGVGVLGVGGFLPAPRNRTFHLQSFSESPIQRGAGALRSTYGLHSTAGTRVGRVWRVTGAYRL